MRELTIFSALALVLLPFAAEAQKDTARHRAVYAEINANQEAYRYAKTTLEEEPADVTVEGWYDAESIRKIVATFPGEHGIGVEEYYLEDGEPLFVYTKYDTVNTLTGKVAAVVEGRYYFKDGDLFKWLDNDKQVVAPASTNFAARAKTVKEDCARFLGALGIPKQAARGQRAPRKNEIRELGLVKKAEDAPYPMYVVTMKLKKDGTEKDFLLNVEDPNVNVRLEDLSRVEGKSVLFYYTSELENSVVEILAAGESLDGPEKLDPAWKKFTGTLGGAEEESGDLPSEISVTDSSGKRMTFESFVHEGIIAVNGKTVAVYYQPLRYERITYIQKEHQFGGASAAANPDVRGLIPDGLQILSYEDDKGAKGEELVFADLDNDGLTDAVALIVEAMNEKDRPFDGEAFMMVFLGRDDGSARLASESKSIYMNSFYDNPLVTVENRVISLKNRGKRAILLSKFRYEAAHSDFMLIGEEYETWDSFGAVEKESTNLLTGERIFQKSHWDEKTEKQVVDSEQKETITEKLVPLSNLY